MAKKAILLAGEQIELAFRAVCHTDGWKAKYWRDTEEEARADGAGHRAQPGNGGHEVHIIKRQIVSERFRG